MKNFENKLADMNEQCDKAEADATLPFKDALEDAKRLAIETARRAEGKPRDDPASRAKRKAAGILADLENDARDARAAARGEVEARFDKTTIEREIERLKGEFQNQV